jgi:hypothetical protein
MRLKPLLSDHPDIASREKDRVGPRPRAIGSNADSGKDFALVSSLSALKPPMDRSGGG